MNKNNSEQNKSDIKNINPQHDLSDEALLHDLQCAYKTINSLQHTTSHKKILLDLERKFHSEKHKKTAQSK